MKKNRDNFPQNVIRELERRVNGRCSRPDCRVPTSGPKVTSEGVNCLGVAAHIEAASPGGPRFNIMQSVAARKSITNGIWLCVNCSTLIDRDERRYTTALLNEWKRKAEQYALDELGRPPISREEHETLKAVIYNDLPRRLVGDAVSTICNLSSNELERIDPRFNVNVEYISGRTAYTFLAKEDVDFNMIVADHFSREFIEKFTDLVEHGTALEVDSAAVKIEGSPLFSFQEGNRGKFVIESSKRKGAVCKIKVVDKENKTFILDDINGQLVGGNKSITFSGKIFGDCFGLIIKFGIENEKSNGAGVELEHQPALWHGRSILALPYFNKIFNFYEFVVQGGKVQLSLEIDGENFLYAESSSLLDSVESRKIYAMLRYVRNLQEIARSLKIDVTYRNGVVLGKSMEAVEDLYALLVKLPKLKGEAIGEIKFSLHTGVNLDNAIPELKRLLSGEISSIRLENHINDMELFGSNFSIPPLLMTYTGVSLESYVETAGVGNYKIILKPDETCTVYVQFKTLS